MRKLTLLDAWIELANQNIIEAKTHEWRHRGVCAQINTLRAAGRITNQRRTTLDAAVYAYGKRSNKFGLYRNFYWHTSPDGSLERAQWCLEQAAKAARKAAK